MSLPESQSKSTWRGLTFFSGKLTHRQKLTRGLAVAGAVAVAIAAGVPPLSSALAEDRNPTAPSREQVAMPVEVLAAKPATTYEVKKAYTGSLVAARRSTLSFERAGEVLTVSVDEGAQVTAGQVLAQLDQRRLNASRKTTAAQLAEARAVLAELNAGPRVETIATAAAEVRSLEAQLAVAERNLVRRQRLVETGSISREEYDEYLYARRAAAARMEAAQKQLEELQAGTRVEQVAAQQARVEALVAQLEDVDHQIQDSRITAPYAGAIVRRRVDEGAIVAAGAPVIDLIEDSQLEAWVGIPAESAARLSVDSPMRVVVNHREYAARVKSIRAELDPVTRTRNVVLALDSTRVDGLVGGQVARIWLTQSVAAEGFWVPASALTPDRRGLWAVYVAVDAGGQHTVATRNVELLHTEGERSYVRGTLQAGDAVIVAGGHKVVEGQRVQIVGE